MTEIAKLIKDSEAIERGKFKLSNGSLTDYYIDKYAFETEPEILEAITDHLADHLVTDDVDVIAGPELGGVPLVTAVSLELGVPAAFIRKGEKHYGTKARIEGEIEKGMRAVIVEDVTTTGGTILDTASLIEEVGGIVEQLIVIVDRNEGAVENAADSGYELEYLVQIGDDLEIDD